MNAQERKKKKKHRQGFHREIKNKKSTKRQRTDGAAEELGLWDQEMLLVMLASFKQGQTINWSLLTKVRMRKAKTDKNKQTRRHQKRIEEGVNTMGMHNGAKPHSLQVLYFYHEYTEGVVKSVKEILLKIMNIYDTCLSSCRFPVQTVFFVSLMYILWYLNLQPQLLKSWDVV